MLCFSQDQLMITMTRPSKRKIQYKKQERSDNGRFIKKSQLTDDLRDDDNQKDNDVVTCEKFLYCNY